jgi:hypothetical protein
LGRFGQLVNTLEWIVFKSFGWFTFFKFVQPERQNSPIDIIESLRTTSVKAEHWEKQELPLVLIESEKVICLNLLHPKKHRSLREEREFEKVIIVTFKQPEKTSFPIFVIEWGRLISFKALQC